MLFRSIKHDQGINWRRAHLNRECWLLPVGPLDNISTEDISHMLCRVGKLLVWEKDPTNKARVLVKVRCTELVEIPKSIGLTDGDSAESESWTFSVEILQQNLLGGGPPNEDPLPDDGVDTHPIPPVVANHDVLQQQAVIQGIVAGGWRHATKPSASG